MLCCCRTCRRSIATNFLATKVFNAQHRVMAGHGKDCIHGKGTDGNIGILPEKLSSLASADLQEIERAKATEATASRAADIRTDGVVERLASMAERRRLSRAAFGGWRSTSALICSCWRAICSSKETEAEGTLLQGAACCE